MNLRKIAAGICFAAIAGSGLALAAGDAEMPSGAKPGECYARVFVPATYSTATEQMLKSEASERIEIVPARYEWTTEQVLVKEASQKMEVVPAQYEWVTEKVMTKPAQTTWKKGSGPIERVDNGTGEIMCLVEEPAVYETVRKRVLKSPATTRTVTVPAKYETIKVQKLASPPQERKVQIPAEYATVTKRAMVSDGRIEWKPVLCQTNISTDVVASLQRALNNAGHNVGSVDGVMGQRTRDGLKSFQRARGLSQGGLTMDTLNALNIRVGG